jgi:hypothetical protein
MKLASHPLHQHEIIMQASTTHKSTLLHPDHLGKDRCNSVGQHLGHQLCHAMYQANGPEIPDLFRAILLWQKSDKGLVDRPKSTVVQAGEGVEGFHDICFDDVPA